MKNLCFITMLLFLGYPGAVTGQITLTLDECYVKATENYPLIKQYDLINSTSGLTISNLKKAYLPQFSVDAQASYQSDVTKLPIDMESLGFPIDIPILSKDQYKLALSVSQLIWDGGKLKAQRKIAESQSRIDEQQLNVSLYSIREKIDQLYFGVLLLNEQLKILDLIEQELLSNRSVTSSMVRNGTATQSDLDHLDVELLKIKQKREAQHSDRLSYLKVLGLFINEELLENTELTTPPNLLVNFGENISRPELAVFDAQIEHFKSRNQIISAKNLPSVALFAQSGYGRPGLNMLEDKFNFFAIGGVKLTWTFGNFYTTKNERKKLDNSIRSTQVLRETFLFNNKLERSVIRSEISKKNEQLKKDDEIIELQNKIKTASEGKYRNGVYRINELIHDINAKNQAVLAKSVHEIELLMTIQQYKIKQGEQ